MAYTTAVTDRTQADIIAQNSKAYMNVADWTRIYNNADEVNGMFLSVLGESITFDTISVPTTASVFGITELNKLTGNIERMRLWMATNMPGAITDAEFVEVKDDWDEGHAVQAPNFVNVNRWEKVLDLMYLWLDAYPGSRLLESGFVRLLEDETPRILG